MNNDLKGLKTACDDANKQVVNFKKSGNLTAAALWQKVVANYDKKIKALEPVPSPPETKRFQK